MLKVRKYNSQLLVFVISKQVIVPLNTLIFVKFHTVFDFQNIAGRKVKKNISLGKFGKEHN